MDFKILIATSDRNFGEQISQTLQDANLSPLLAQSTAEAAFIAQVVKCPIAIIDCELTNPGPAYLVAELRNRIDNLRLVFIPNSEGCTKKFDFNPSLDIFLPRPFFMPDLIEILKLWVAEEKASLIINQQPTKIEEYSPELTWLQETERAEQYLSLLSTEDDSIAVFILHGDRILAYTGSLPQSAAVELADIVGSHWLNGDGSDLACFVNNGINSDEYMLYATSLKKGIVLAFVFAKDMPFSKIRKQAKLFAWKLTSHQQGISTETLSTQLSIEQAEELDGEEFEHVPVSDDKQDEDDVIAENQQAIFEDLLTTLDIPEPDGTKEYWLPKIEYPFSNQVDKRSPQNISEIIPKMSTDTTAVQESSHLSYTNQRQNEDVQLESGSFALHDLAYSCLLIPRLPEHNLTGVLVNILSVEMSRLCLAFGWRLENINIPPEYLSWVVSVTPDVTAIKVIKKIRAQTSNLFFSEFPRLAKENPSGDYWAPGYAVIHGRRSLSETLIKDILMKIRSRQGVESGIKIKNA